MLKEVDGYAIELGRQVLLSGTWDDDFPNWKMEFEYKFYKSEKGARAFFHKWCEMIHSGKVDCQYASLWTAKAKYIGNRLYDFSCEDQIDYL